MKMDLNSKEFRFPFSVFYVFRSPDVIPAYYAFHSVGETEFNLLLSREKNTLLCSV